MRQVRALVLVSQDDPTADQFRTAVESRPGLSSAAELRFAIAADAGEVIGEAEVVTCGVLPPDLIDRAVKLQWIAYWSAGVDGKITPQIQDRKLLITNASGVHGPNIAEHVLAFMLMFTRRMEVHMRSQIAQVWERRMPIERPPASELYGQTLGIVGYGRIGEALAERAAAFGMRIVAVKRNPESRYSTGTKLEALYPLDGLPDLLRQSDHVCISLPYTSETHHLFNAELIKCMKPTAYLYNIARGAIIDESALVTALAEGRIAGAGLDVFETEPLPASSPLWGMRNVIITPHVAGLTPHYFERFAALFAENMERYINGQRLHNLFDAARGY